MTLNDGLHPPQPSNDNHDELATASSALDCLYRLRREMLQIDPETMSFARRRQRQEMLAKFPEVEKMLLNEL